MAKVTGVKSVDFKIEAEGHGVVNWNGSVSLQGNDGKEVNNHSIPKLRGFTNKTGKVKENSSYEYKKRPEDIDLNETPVYISPECIKYNLFKEEAFNISAANSPEDARKLLPSLVGLVKGYVIASGNVSIGKKSPLLMECFNEVLKNGNFEQYSKAGSKSNDTSIFSKTTLGDTKYIGYGSFVIEDTFIPLDDVFGRKAMVVPTEAEGIEVAKEITEFLKTLDFEGKKKPQATYSNCYVRNGSIMKAGEAGISLNDDSLDILVEHLLEKLSSLHIRQGRGWLAVRTLTVDYNDSNQPMRIKKDENSISSKRNSQYANYWVKGTSENEIESNKLKDKQKTNKEKKNTESEDKKTKNKK